MKKLSILAIFLSLWTCFAQEQQVLWRQIKIGTYSVTWPASQGASSTVLTNDGSGNLTWAAASGGGYWTRTTGSYNYLEPTTSTDRVLLGNGSETAPAFSFLNWLSGCAECGMFYNGTSMSITIKGSGAGRGYIDFANGSSAEGGFTLRRGDTNYGSSWANRILSRNYANNQDTALRFQATSLIVPDGTESVPGIIHDGYAEFGIYYASSPTTSYAIKVREGTDQAYVHFGGKYFADSGLFLRRGNNDASQKSTISAVQYDGSTLTKLRLKASSVELAVGTTGSSIYVLPASLPASDGLCLTGNTNGTTAWTTCNP